MAAVSIPPLLHGETSITGISPALAISAAEYGISSIQAPGKYTHNTFDDY